MNRRIRSLILPLTAILLAVMACGLPTSQADINLAVTQTLEALARDVEEADSGEPQTDDGGAAVEATEEPPATEEPAVEATATPTVEHSVFPTGPGGVSSFMTDRSTASLASERRANADNFEWNLLERPFTANDMDYKDYLDITRGELSLNGPFVYATIYLEGSAPADAKPWYGVEVDTDLDGHGDWLVMGLLPSDSEWTTDGVRACRDANGDVGGPTPMRADSPNSARDGYEDCVFENGYGIGPDEAWIRRDPGNSNRVQIAFMFSLIGSDGEFLWGAWADEGVKEPGWFDYHDHFTLPEAGSPASNSSEYPLKALALVDNTCRWGYGFQPTGSEPGACYVPPTATPVPQGSISGYVYRGGGSSPSSNRFSGVTVTLGSGACTSSGYKSTSTNGDGYFSFSELPPGTYCVTIQSSSLPSASYGWQPMYPNFGAVASPPFNPYQQISLGENENRINVNFAFIEIIG